MVQPTTSGRSSAPVLALCSHLHGQTGILDLLRSWESQGDALLPTPGAAAPTQWPAAPADSPARTASQSTAFPWHAPSRLDAHASGRLAGRSINQTGTQAEKGEHSADAMAGPSCLSLHTARPEYSQGAARRHEIVDEDCGVGPVQRAGCEDQKDTGESSFDDDCLQDKFLEGPVVDTCRARHAPARVQGAGCPPKTVRGKKARASTQGRCDLGLLQHNAGTRSAPNVHLGAEPSAPTRRPRRGRTNLNYCEEEWDEDETHPRGWVADRAQAAVPPAPFVNAPLPLDHLIVPLTTEQGCSEETGLSQEPSRGCERSGAGCGRGPSSGAHRHDPCRQGGSHPPDRRSNKAKRSASKCLACASSVPAMPKPVQVSEVEAQGPKRRRREIQQRVGMTLIRFQ
jgi:hypothetical protein